MAAWPTRNISTTEEHLDPLHQESISKIHPCQPERVLVNPGGMDIRN